MNAAFECRLARALSRGGPSSPAAQSAQTTSVSVARSAPLHSAQPDESLNGEPWVAMNSAPSSRRFTHGASSVPLSSGVHPTTSGAPATQRRAAS